MCWGTYDAAKSRRLANPLTLRCALRALRREFLGFSFSYPLEMDEAAGPADSLHYFLYSSRLKWEHMRMGPDGIPRTWGRTTGTNYWPAYVAWYRWLNLAVTCGKADRSIWTYFQKTSRLAGSPRGNPARRLCGLDDEFLIIPSAESFSANRGSLLMPRGWL
jgi:hypothetical protein